MSRLEWLLRRTADGLDHRQMTLVALIVLVALLVVDGWLPRSQQLQQVQADSALLAEHVRALREAAALPGAAADVLPAMDSLPEATRRLQQLAARQGATFTKASYRLEREGELYRYRISTELESPYKAIRAFLHAALEEFPSLSLDRLEIRRVDGRMLPHTVLELSLHFLPETGKSEGSP